MAEQTYISLACQVLGIDPSTVLKSREEEDGVVIINSAGQKFRFSFEYLEDFKQYLEDNRQKTAAKTRKTTPAAKKIEAEGEDPERSPRDKGQEIPVSRSKKRTVVKKTPKSSTRRKSTAKK